MKPSAWVLWLQLTVASRTALEALFRHPLRALLTGFGILVGVLAVTVVITLGEGAERAVQGQLENLGENLITITARTAAKSGAGSNKPSLTLSDARAIESEIDGVFVVAPVLERLARVRFEKRNTSAQVLGTTSAYFSARNYKMSSGSFWQSSERTSRVVLLGSTVVTELFPHAEPLGASIRIGRHLFRVVGVLEAKGQTPFGMDQDNLIVMPIATMRSKISPGRPGEVGQIAVGAKDGVSTQDLMRPIRSLLRQRHHISSGDEDDFSLRDQTRLAESQRGVVAIMRMLLLSIAGVSLVIGGIGVMNIMLVSVAERSKEIGTRLAVGARASDILSQFLIEAVILALLGGFAGAALAAALVPLMEDYFGWELVISGRSLAVASTVSISIGIVFGFLPARRAAMLDPVEALRRE